mmetsp:Transcript_21847/g.74050  ORF Transcript_21847/g.74050 Transcript_21847/m.74050 type:complete len:352 (-) Transcript_21847:506-1561(-)
MHHGHEFLNVELNRRRQLDRVARPEQELVPVLDGKVGRREDGDLQARLVLVVQDGPLEKVCITPKELLLQVPLARDVAHRHATRRDLQSRRVLVLHQLHRRVDARLDRKHQLVVGHDCHVLVDAPRDDLQPLLHRVLGLGRQRPLALDGANVKRVDGGVFLLGHGPHESRLGQINQVALALVRVEERRLCKVRVVAEEVAHARGVEHGVSLDPGPRQPAALQKPPLVLHHRVPVAVRRRVDGKVRGGLAAEDGEPFGLALRFFHVRVPLRRPHQRARVVDHVKVARGHGGRLHHTFESRHRLDLAAVRRRGPRVAACRGQVRIPKVLQRSVQRQDVQNHEEPLLHRAGIRG